jgi:hypothetical protein
MISEPGIASGSRGYSMSDPCSRPMPRARATIASLLSTHHTQLERVAELEMKIEQATNPHITPANVPPAVSPQPTIRDGKRTTAQNPRLSFEEAVKAEEAALRLMESQLGTLRASRTALASSQKTIPDGEKDAAFTATTALQSSPPPSAPVPSQTPAKAVHPYPSRNITNSLVNGTTPRRPRATPGGPGGVLAEGFEFDRFSPLKFLGTPRAAGRLRHTKSTLREVMGSPTVKGEGYGEGLVGRGIFARKDTGAGLVPSSAVGSMSGSTHSPGKEKRTEHEQDNEDQTVRFVPLASPKPAAELPEDMHREHNSAAPDAGASQTIPEAVRAGTTVEAEGVLEGVDYALPRVEQALVSTDCRLCRIPKQDDLTFQTKIREGLAEMLRQGLTPGAEMPETVKATM